MAILLKPPVGPNPNDIVADPPYYDVRICERQRKLITEALILLSWNEHLSNADAHEVALLVNNLQEEMTPIPCLNAFVI